MPVVMGKLKHHKGRDILSFPTICSFLDVIYVIIYLMDVLLIHIMYLYALQIYM